MGRRSEPLRPRWASGGRRVSEICDFMDNRDLAVDLVDAIASRLDNGAVGNVGSTGNLLPGEPEQEKVRYYRTDGYATAEGPHPGQLTARGLAGLIAGLAPNFTPGQAGARTVEFLEGAYASAARGERVDVAGLTTASATSPGGNR